MMYLTNAVSKGGSCAIRPTRMLLLLRLLWRTSRVGNQRSLMSRRVRVPHDSSTPKPPMNARQQFAPPRRAETVAGLLTSACHKVINKTIQGEVVNNYGSLYGLKASYQSLSYYYCQL
jgi:hypothetical protein